MGGSGISGDIVSALSAGSSTEIRTWKDYGLPREKNALYLFVSFSGNTEETISGLKTAMHKCPSRILGVVTSGGKLKKIAEKKNLRRIIIPSGDLTPREALGYNVNASFTLLRSQFPRLRAPRVSLITPKKLEDQGKKIARAIKGKIALVYTGEKDHTVGYAWKMFIDETAKTPCFVNVLPEMNHNEIQSFEKTKFPFSALFLAEKKSTIKLKKRIHASAHVLQNKKISSTIIPLSGKTQGDRIWNGILLGAWTGLYLARMNKEDPKSTPAIASLKKIIAK
jgi:glucose/mannose-6-phosphate isomerase